MSEQLAWKCTTCSHLPGPQRTKVEIPVQAVATAGAPQTVAGTLTADCVAATAPQTALAPESAPASAPETAAPQVTDAASQAVDVASQAVDVASQAAASAPETLDGAHEKMNRLRAGVLGANDGIVSTAAVVLGVAGASSSPQAIIIAGMASLVGGAISMALGEYVSVAAQLDSEKAALRRLGREPHPGELVSPMGAAIASFLSFVVGALIPLLAVALPPVAWRVPAAFIATLIALAITGYVSARIGDADPKRATLRVVIGGFLGLGATFLIGHLFGMIVS
ncbi:VIT1/CCC1 transporter family protein [Actinobaculum suis]|uniref:VIT1/CCC1 transporter family protein n=1 Tax=Actinobaculum suis TaxID=1657 RepID=UPI0009F35E1B|nr:VIT1/CCC1 transporter family protein [Actinobaculum suis]